MRVSNERLKHLAENMTTLDPEFQSVARELQIMRKLEEAIREYKMDFRPIARVLNSLDTLEES